MNFNAELVSPNSLQSYFTVIFLQLNKLNTCTRCSVVTTWRSHFSLSKYFMAGHIRYFSGGGNFSSNSNM